MALPWDNGGMTTTAATRLLQGLDASEIIARLEELDAEAKALRVLLRAARERDRRCRPVDQGDTRDAT